MTEQLEFVYAFDPLDTRRRKYVFAESHLYERTSQGNGARFYKCILPFCSARVWVEGNRCFRSRKHSTHSHMPHVTGYIESFVLYEP